MRDIKISLCSIRFPGQAIEEVVEQTSRLGYDGIEIVKEHLDDYLKRKGDLGSLQELIHSRGLVIPMIAPAFNFTGTQKELRESIDRAYCCITQARALGCPLIRAFVSHIGSAEATETEWGQCVSTLKELATEAADTGITFAVETHPGQLMDTVEATLTLIHRVDAPGLRVLLDIWHLYHEGQADPIAALKALYPYTVHIHAKNMIRTPSGSRIAYLEDGDLDYHGFLKALKETNYDGFISVEWFGDNPWTAAAKELAYLRRFT